MLRRKTTPRVKDGKVQKKDRSVRTAPDGYTQGSSLQIIRHAPGPGQVHVVDEHDVRRFLDLLPEWPQLGAGINAIVLDNDQGSFDGCYRHDGVIILSSWSERMVTELDLEYHEEHREVLERMGVPFDIVTPEPPAVPPEPFPTWDREMWRKWLFARKKGRPVPVRKFEPEPRTEPFARCWFDPATARDFMLMHVFLHELGHHHDKKTLRRRGGSRGEDYAEAWAIEKELELWPKYRGAFGRSRGR